MNTITTRPIRPSGVQWLGDIPADWQIKDLKYLTKFVNGCAFKPDDWGDSGIPIIRIENLNGSEDFNYTTREVDGRYLVNKGDLLFGWSGNRGTSFGPFIWWRDGRHYLNQHIFRLEGYTLDVRCFYWLLKAVTAYVESQVSGIIGLVHITKEDLGNIPVPLAAPDEQRAIAAFLDRKTAEIDAVLAAKEQMLGLLQEKRLTLISQAVTRGLNAGVPMKDSGVEWLGQVPAHWAVERLKFRFSKIEQGWSPQCENRQAEPGEWGVLKVGCMNSGVYDESENKALPPELEPVADLEVRPGDVLMSRSNTVELVGMVGIVHQTQGRILLCDKLYRIDIHQESLIPEYGVCLLQSRPARLQIERDATGASPSMKNISTETVGNLWLAFPPMNEQHEILAYIHSECSRLDLLRDRIQAQIAKLREYRQGVISAAVTGKLAVPQEVPA
jgi:type I restriction enzyme S subunit